MGGEITLYTTGCPRCVVLERKLRDKGVDFDVVTDVEELVGLGFTSAPALRTGDSLMGFAEAVRFVNSL